MKINNYNRIWLFKNIRRFFKNDPIFRSFNYDLILCNLKSYLRKSTNIEDLISFIESDRGFRALRIERKKEGNKSFYYYYPSLVFQLKYLEKIYSDLYRIGEIQEDLIKYSFSNEEILAIEDIYYLPDDEKVNAVKENSRNRNTFGNKLNPSTPLAISNKKSTVLQEERVKNSSLVHSFKFEYNFFSYKVLEQVKKIAGNGKGIFFQTDIEKFYHNLNVEQLINFFEKAKFKENSKNIVRALKELIGTEGANLNYSSRLKEIHDSLPIGWIYSGPIANIILLEIHELIEKKKHELIQNNDTIKNIEVISFADDFIFLISLDSTQEALEINYYCELFVKLLDKSFFDLGFIDVKCHNIKSPKSNSFLIIEEFSAIASTNFLNFDTSTYLDREANWGVLGSLINPIDDDLVMNDNVALVQNLNQIKINIENGKINSDDFLSNYLDRILYKMNSNGIKYISYIILVSISFLKRERCKNKLNSEVFNKTLKPIYNKLKEKNACLDSYVKFFMKILHYLKDDDNEKCFVDYLNILEQFRYDFFSIRKESFGEAYVISLIFNETKLISVIKGYKYKEKFIDNDKTLNSYNLLSKIVLGSNEGNEFHYNVLGNLLFRIDKSDIFKNILLKTIKSDLQNDIKVRILEESLYIVLDFLSVDDLHVIKKNMLFSDPVHKTLEVIIKLKINLDFDSSIEGFIQELEKLRLRKSEFIQGEFGSIVEEIRNVVVLTSLYLVSDNDERCKVLAFWLKRLDRFSLLDWPIETKFVNQNFDVLHSFLRHIFSKKKEDLKFSVNDQGIIDFIKFELNEKKLYCEKENGFKEIDLDYILNNYSQKIYNGIDDEIKICISRLGIDWSKDIHSMQYNVNSRDLIDSLIITCLHNASEEKADIIIFPELSLPRKYIHKYLRLAARFNLILIAGVEYRMISSGFAYNQTIISIPTNCRSIDGSFYHCFIQTKKYPAADELKEIRRLDRKYYQGGNQFLFKSKKWKNFAVLTCSDFLSTELKYSLKGRVQTLFVPAQNYDSTTYNHLAESALRELYCYCVICNNKKMGSSGVYAPFRDSTEREVFKISGNASPDFHIIKIIPHVIDLVQSNCNRNIVFKENEKLKKWKQLPPDWEKKK